ncbi:MAG TPA: 2OG-Fe(II) oxygenase [Kineosporiaceae bacterium]|nr:2OG-Fe(II) oxygenase [Kineosporiaceae bacterium]
MIDEQRPRELLAALLTAHDEASGSVQLAAKPPTALRVVVDGLDAVRLPLTDEDARRLKAAGRPARFGRGEQTLTDRRVRDTWEVPRESVHAEWAAPALAADLEVVREELGLPRGARVRAELHALLVYEPGQFFVPHQDSEKDDAMVATLVVTLPSQHSGGELVVHHLGEATTYRGFADRLALVAFYADCRHEVRPVTSGYRVTLTYNLLLDGDTARVPSDQATIDEVARALRAHTSTPAPQRYGPPHAPPGRLVVLLDHEYTERGLAASRLKGDDARRVALLRAAAGAAGFETVLALADVHEVRDALTEDGDDRWDDWDDDEDDEIPDDEIPDDDIADDGPLDQAAGELLDSEIQLTWWADGEGPGSGPISSDVTDDEVCTLTPSAWLRPYASEHTGYMGNYGNTVDRWYRRAALVAWPAELGFANRAEASPVWAVEELVALARAADPAVAADAARTLAPFWDATVTTCPRQAELLAGALSAAIAVDDPDVAEALLAPFPVESVGTRHAEGLAAVRERYGSSWFEGLVRAWAGESRPLQWRRSGPSREQWLGALPEVCDALTAAGPAGGAAARSLVETAWGLLAALVRPALARPTAAGRHRLEVLGLPLAAVVRVAGSLRRRDLLEEVRTFCREHGDPAGPWVLAVLRRAAPGAASAIDVFHPLAADQQARLAARLEQPIRRPDDWSMSLPEGCACELCGRLAAFLSEPGHVTLEWPLAKAGRQHVHGRIDGAELPVTHETRRRGSPYTLVLTKTPDLFEREARQRDQDAGDLALLRATWR